MNRLVIAKIELAAARERLTDALRDFRAAAGCGSVGRMTRVYREKRAARFDVERLEKEVQELEAAAELDISRTFGPGAWELQ